MIKVHKLENSPEAYASEQLANIAFNDFPDIKDSNEVFLEIIPSVQCFGETVRDIDLLVLYADYRNKSLFRNTNSGKLIQSFCATIEIKNHSSENIQFDGPKCFVSYKENLHNVTSQSESQKYSVRKYITKHSKSKKAPWITNIIWLRHYPKKELPKQTNNLLGSNSSWQDLLDLVALLSGSNNNIVQAFPSRDRFHEILNIFSVRLIPSPLDRKRLEKITKKDLDKDHQKYFAKLGKQLLVFRGRGGTGKTVRLLSLAYQAYDEQGLQILLLTYNKSLVSDLTRLITLLNIKDAVAEGSIAIKSIYEFMGEWLSALGAIQRNEPNYNDRYEAIKVETLSMMSAGAIQSDDIIAVKRNKSRKFYWDLVLIDESQDWPDTERDLLYKLYGHKKIVLADGVDQFVRGVSKVDWREHIDKSESQIVTFHKSLRLKSSLCEMIGHFAEQIDFNNWNLEPEPIIHGGKVIILVGNALAKEFHEELWKSAKKDGNKPVDMLFCVPPSWVKNNDGKRESIVASAYKSWNQKVWDGVDTESRAEFPTSLDQFRIVQYESCRGLEGWVVINFGFDEFFDFKIQNPEISSEAKNDMFYDRDEAALDYTKKWIMIPLTRAIDTLVLHVKNPNSYIGKCLHVLHDKYPNNVEILVYK